ncbi:MAG: M48 family metallopeptidase [Desulfovibrio sp.]
MQTLSYGEERIRYQVCHVPDREGKVAIHVHPDGSVQVDAPMDAELDEIKSAVQKRARWVMEHIVKARELREYVLPREYVSGESHYYQGWRFQLKVVRSENAKGCVKLHRGQLMVEAEDVGPARVRKLLRDWYRARAQDYFARRLKNIAAQSPWLAGVPEWRLLTMKKQWGSCSPKGILSLNPHLVKAPRECIEYVLLHELCHLQEHNHSPRFYRLLTEQMPEWKSVKAKLDGMSELLLNE